MTLPDSILEASNRLRSGTMSPTDLVEACLEQIARFENQVHAWVLVDSDGARQAARELKAELAAGQLRGPLHGVPVGIKDIIDVAEWPTLAGSRTRLGHKAERDAPLVTRLRDAGAIILGKTVTTEFASFDPPPTRNPWNLERTPGGSSSGSAAAVALGMCLGAIGSQTGGSITRPASFCGVAGLKPTLGAVSTEGIVPLSFTMDHPGPIGRCANDLAILFEAIRDPRIESDASEPSASRSSAPPRLTLSEPFFLERADADVRQAMHAACETLTAAEARIERIPLPASFADVHRMHRRIMAAEAAEYHRGVFVPRRDAFGPAIGQLLDEGLALSSSDYIEAIRHRELFRREIQACFAPPTRTAFLTPATVTPAPGIQTTGDPLFNSPWSYCGLPSVSFPCGLSSTGLPLSLQLIGPPHSEAAILSTAQWCEAR